MQELDFCARNQYEGAMFRKSGDIKGLSFTANRTRRIADESDIDEVLRQAEKYPNITGAIFDDFFIAPENDGGKVARHSVANVKTIRDRLHQFPLRKLYLWVVWYKKQLDHPVEEYTELFDVITFWNMRAPAEIEEIDGDFAKLVDKTAGKSRMTGCYMWNYGEGKPLSIQEIKAEVEKYYGWIKDGLSAGIIFCSNCCADLGLAAAEWVREWIKEVGQEEL